MLDLHCHMLPNIDDGPQSLAESLEMARMAVANGITHTIVTPHIHLGRYDNDRHTIRKALDSFKQHLEQESIPLTLGMAAEVRIDPQMIPMIEQERIPWLGRCEDYRYLLLELPHSHIPIGTARLIHWLLKRKIRPIIAHPERNKAVIRNLKAIAPFVNAGCLLQITAGSVAGSFGLYARKRARQLLKRRWVHLIATDAHNTKVRTPDLQAGQNAAAAIIGETESRALVLDNPKRILEGTVEQKADVA